MTDKNRAAWVDKHSAALHMTASIRLNLGFARQEGTMPDVETLLESAMRVAQGHQDRAMAEIMAIDVARGGARPRLALVMP